MKCLYCQAEMKRGATIFHIDRKNVHISLDKAPAWICPQCGEACFGEKDIENMQEMIRAIEQKAREMEKIT